MREFRAFCSGSFGVLGFRGFGLFRVLVVLGISGFRASGLRRCMVLAGGGGGFFGHPVQDGGL